MRKGSVGKLKGGRSGRSLVRTLGRGAIWIVFGLLLVNGVGAVVASPPKSTGAKDAPEGAGTDVASTAFAVSFARAFLADPSGAALAPYMAEGARVGTGRPPSVPTAAVAQAEVSATEDLGGGREILTVACELRDARTLYLAVPLARSGSGEVAALGAPWIVAEPGRAPGADSDRPQPLSGSAAPDIESLVAKFLPTYLSASEAEDLSYLLVPGAAVQPLGGAVAFVSLGDVKQIGDGEGPRRTVLAAVRVSDPTGGATYPLVYRLDLERRGADGRWYVAALEGVSA